MFKPCLSHVWAVLGLCLPCVYPVFRNNGGAEVDAGGGGAGTDDGSG